jgi:hypothetical protein
VGVKLVMHIAVRSYDRETKESIYRISLANARSHLTHDFSALLPLIT